MCYHFDDIVKVEDVDSDNILFDEKSCQKILIYGILYTTFMDAKPLCISSIKWMDLSKF